MQSFDTARLHLRPLGEGDEALYYRLYTDPDLMRHIATPLSPEAAQRGFHAALKQLGGKRMLWVIITRNGSARGAERGILGIVPEGEAAEVGVMLFAEGQACGFAAEVISAIADVLFQTSEIRRLWARHAVDNRAMSRVMEKLEFVPQTSESANDLSELRWQLLREEWLMRRPTRMQMALPDEER